MSKRFLIVLATAISLTTITPSATSANPIKALFDIINKAPKIIGKISGYRKSKTSIAPAERCLMRDGKKVFFEGKKVFKRNALFNPHYKDGIGKSNLDRMRNGNAPVGGDGRQVELHHIGQKDKGPIVETSYTEHHLKYNNEIHKSTKSEIDRKNFDNWRRVYWKHRAKDFD